MGLVVLVISVMLSKDFTDIKMFWARFVKNVLDTYKLEKLGDIESNDERLWRMPLPVSQNDIANDLNLHPISNLYNFFSRMISILLTSMLFGYLIVQVARFLYDYQDGKYWSGIAETFVLSSAVAMSTRLAATAFFRRRYKAAVVTALRSFVQKMMNLSYASEVDVANLLVTAVVKAALPNGDMLWIHVTAEELVHAASEETLVAKVVVRVAINLAQPEHKLQVARAVIFGIIKGMSINAKNSLIREVIFSATELLRSNNMPMLYGRFVAKKVLPRIKKTSPIHHKTGLEKIRVEASVFTPLLENQIRRTTLMALERKIALEEETTDAALQAAKIQADAGGTHSIDTSKLLDIMAEAAAMAYNKTIAEEMLCIVIEAAPVHHKIRIAQASIEVLFLNTADDLRASAVSKAILAAALVAPTKQRPVIALKMAESAVAAVIGLILKKAKDEIEAKGKASLIISKYSWLIYDIVRAVYSAAFSIKSASISASELIGDKADKAVSLFNELITAYTIQFSIFSLTQSTDSTLSEVVPGDTLSLHTRPVTLIKRREILKTTSSCITRSYGTFSAKKDCTSKIEVPAEHALNSCYSVFF